MSTDNTQARGTVAALGALVVAVLASLLVGAPAASAYPGAPWFEPYEHMSKYYTGNFPDPDVLRVGDTYYAYGTATGGSYLPVMSSTDLVSWRPRSPYDPGKVLNPDRDVWFNDGLPKPAVWGGDFDEGRLSKRLWAPGVEKFGETYVAFYALQLPSTETYPERFCISVATATSPLGPFTDTTKAPLQCSPVQDDPRGSIDPEPFIDPQTGTPYLLWKTEGKVNVHSPRVFIRELTPSGTAFAAGSQPKLLLEQDQGWEGYVVENPSMIRHEGELYLFYSGNSWNSGSYATGYALCKTPLGPCEKPRETPLMAKSRELGKLGPGGASAFHDASGALRLAYHYWNAPYTSYPAYPACEATKTCQSQGQRRMAVTTVSGSGAALMVGPDAPAGPVPAPTQTPTPTPEPTPEPAPTPKPAPTPTPTPTGTPTVLSPEQACPTGEVQSDAFVDDDGNLHERAIDCVRWWGVASGGSDGTYRPLAGVTRAQMATFLANSVDISGGTLPEAQRDYFADDDGSPHERSINRLAAVGVVSGKGGGYAPNELVTRAQMATFLVRAVKLRTGVALTSTVDWFPDDDASPHQPSINAAAGAGLASGAGSGGYAPEASVRRDQMASFLARVLELYVEKGATTPSSR